MVSFDWIPGRLGYLENIISIQNSSVNLATDLDGPAVQNTVIVPNSSAGGVVVQ